MVMPTNRKMLKTKMASWRKQFTGEVPSAGAGRELSKVSRAIFVATCPDKPDKLLLLASVAAVFASKVFA